MATADFVALVDPVGLRVKRGDTVSVCAPVVEAEADADRVLLLHALKEAVGELERDEESDDVEEGVAVGLRVAELHALVVRLGTLERVAEEAAEGLAVEDDDFVAVLGPAEEEGEVLIDRERLAHAVELARDSVGELDAHALAEDEREKEGHAEKDGETVRVRKALTLAEGAAEAVALARCDCAAACVTEPEAELRSV